LQRLSLSPLTVLLLAGLLGCSVQVKTIVSQCDDSRPCAAGERCEDNLCKPNPPTLIPDDAGPGPVVQPTLCNGPCAVGLGACLREGVVQCTDGGPMICSATAGEPSRETCGNTVDEDCDGRVSAHAEVVLVEGATQFSWGQTASGLSAVFTRNGRIWFQRFDAELKPRGNPLELTEGAPRRVTAATVVPFQGGAAAAWSEESGAGVERVAVAYLDGNGELARVMADGGVFTGRVYFDVDVTQGSARLAVSNEDQFLMVAFVGPNGSLYAAVLQRTGAVTRAPAVVVQGSLATSRVLEVDVEAVGQNDFMLAYNQRAMAPFPGESTVFHRIQEDLVMRNQEQADFDATGSARSTRVVQFKNPDGGVRNLRVAGAWLEEQNGTSTLWASNEVGDTMPLMLATGPTAESSYQIDAASSAEGPVVVVMHAATGKLTAMVSGKPGSFDLSISGLQRSYAKVSPSVAVLQDAGTAAVAYQVTTSGKPEAILGQLYCR
jgi:hypothetical protein